MGTGRRLRSARVNRGLRLYPGCFISIHSFISQVFIRACDVPRPVLGTGNITVKETNQDKPEAMEERKKVKKWPLP